MFLWPVTLTWMDSQSGSLSKHQLSIGTTSINTAMEAFTRTPGAPPRLTDNFLFNSREKRLTQRGPNLWGWDSSHLRSENHLHVWSWDADLLHPPSPGACGCVLSLSISSCFHPEAYWFLMFSISLSKGLISILQHHFQDNSVFKTCPPLPSRCHTFLMTMNWLQGDRRRVFSFLEAN